MNKIKDLTCGANMSSLVVFLSPRFSQCSPRGVPLLRALAATVLPPGGADVPWDHATSAAVLGPCSDCCSYVVGCCCALPAFVRLGGTVV